MPRPAAANSITLAIILCFAAVYIVWGSTYLAIRIAIETMPPFAMAASRFLIAGIGMFAYCRWRGMPIPNWQQVRNAMFVGVLLFVGGNGCVVWAQQHIASSMAALLVAATPFWMVLLGWLVFKDPRPRPSVVAALVLGFVGVALLINPAAASHGTASPANPQHGGMSPAWQVAGGLMVLLASFCWSTGSLVARRIYLPEGTLQQASIEMMGAGIVMTVIALLLGEAPLINLSSISLRSWLAWLYLVVFGSVLALSCYMYILRRCDTAAVATYAYVNPVVALALGWLIANETMTPVSLAASGVILAAVVIVTSRQRRAARDAGNLEPRPTGVER